MSATGFDLNKYKPEPIKQFTPNRYQQAIFDWIESGTGNACVDAVAGSGKTTTLVQAANLTRNAKGLVLMFSKRMQTEVAPKFSDTNFDVRTSHSIGNAAVRKLFPATKLNEKKYRKYVYGLLDTALSTGSLDGHRLEDWELGVIGEVYPVKEIIKLIDLVRATLTRSLDTDAVLKVAAHYNLDIPPSINGFCARAVAMCIQRGVKESRIHIDFGDMVYLPCVIRGMRPATYDWVFIDECQDLTAAQRTIAGMACRGRMLFVGDRYQSIFGFAGADTQSVDRIVSEFDCTMLPLHICYRCPTSHLDRVRSIVPHIQAAPNATAGITERVEILEIPGIVKEGTLVVCRLTAPLITLAYSLIRNKISVRVIGRDIGAGILALLKLIRKECYLVNDTTYDQLAESVDDYQFDQVTMILASNGADDEDPKIQSITDRCDCLSVIVKFCGATTFEDLMWSIKDLFKKDKAMVDLSTVHRAKGLEAEHVVILKPELFSLFGGNDWQVKQESYLEYVAGTRSKERLTIAH